MRITLLALLGMSCALGALGACGGNDNNNKSTTMLPQCSDGEDNDGDGLIDFPDDPGCVGENDEDESSLPSPQCSDGRDNDGDGKIDFPQDPGCTRAAQDTETDDCPDGPDCPQCSNGRDDDGNGQTDYPSDIGCSSASDTDEFTDDPLACGATVVLKQLPFDGHVMMGNLGPGGPSNLMSMTCGGSGKEDVYELRLSGPKVIKATTNLPGTATTTDTVLSVRDIGCMTELTCNDDDLTTGAVDGSSSVVASADTAGVYYLVVDNNSGLGGAYELQVNLLSGVGEACDPAVVSCGDGLVCRIPLNGTTNVCSHPMCSDGVDDDGDGQADYPTDPGCDTPDDNDETDTCPGAGCPQCSDTIDNDGDGHTDYPNDPQCTAASTHSESCVDADPVNTITAVTTAGTTTGTHNDSSQTCGSSLTMTAPDVTYRFHAPMQLASLNITTLNPSFDAVTAAYGPSCNGTALSCQDSSPIGLTNLPAGDVYIVVDGYSSGAGTFSLQVNGVIKNNEICEDPLVSAGVLACGPTATCQGTTGNKHCLPAACSDGVDNNGDGKIDYPLDPGCDSPLDTTETTVCPGAGCPVCADGVDNDTDTHIDYATDMSCWAASGNNEAFCGVLDQDRAQAVVSFASTGTTVGLHNDFGTETCQNNAIGNDVAFSVQLPVATTTITFDTVDPGTSFDTVLSIRANTCAPASELAGGCNDDSVGTRSTLTMTNLAAGNYSLILDGYNGQSGTYVLHAHGLVANGTACTSPLFSTGVLSCTAPATCNGTVCM